MITSVICVPLQKACIMEPSNDLCCEIETDQVGLCTLLGMAGDPHLGSYHPATHRNKSNCVSDISADGHVVPAVGRRPCFLFLPSMATGWCSPKQSGVYRMDEHRDGVCPRSPRGACVVLCDTLIKQVRGGPSSKALIKNVTGEESPLHSLPGVRIAYSRHARHPGSVG